MGPFKGVVPLDLIEDLFHGGIKRCVPLEPIGRSGWCRPVSSGGSVDIVWCLAIILGGSKSFLFSLGVGFLVIGSCRATRESSTFMYFWALESRAAVEVGGFLERENRKSNDRRPAMKAVRMTLSSFSATCRASVLKRVTKLRSDSPSVCRMLRSWVAGRHWRWASIKWLRKESLRCWKVETESVGNWLNHSRVDPFSVTVKARDMISSGNAWRIMRVL